MTAISLYQWKDITDSTQLSSWLKSFQQTMRTSGMLSFLQSCVSMFTNIYFIYDSISTISFISHWATDNCSVTDMQSLITCLNDYLIYWKRYDIIFLICRLVRKVTSSFEKLNTWVAVYRHTYLLPRHPKTKLIRRIRFVVCVHITLFSHIQTLLAWDSLPRATCLCQH